MNAPNNDKLREAVNLHLGSKTADASKTNFEKAKTELVFTKTALSKAISLLTIEKYLEIVEQNFAGVSPAEKEATEIVDSYFIPLPTESINAAYSRAKKEAIAKLKGEVAQLRYFTFKDYSFKRKKKAPARKIRTTNFDNVRVEKRRTTKS